MEDIKKKLAVARGEEPADLVFRNGRIVNVLTAEIHEGDVAVSGGRIAGIGSYDGREVVDCAGRFIAPSFIDGHIHIESTMLTAAEFARAVLPHGTGAAVIDPHEYANILGLRGIEYLLAESAELPVDLFIMVSSCVPATHLETSGARITAEDISSLIGRERIAGVAEMMNFPGVYLGWDSELEKIAAAGGREVDGHAPRLTGKNLNAYILAGVHSDHECTTLEEAREKARRGMHILLREGTAERNLRDLLPLVTPAIAANFSFASDDKHPHTLMEEGHIDHHIREAIAFGIDPLVAFQMGTINTARHYRLRNIGAIAPRMHADLVILSDLERVRIDAVYKRGRLVAAEGAPLWNPEIRPAPAEVTGTMHPAPFDLYSFSVQARPGRIRVIELVPGQIVTRQAYEIPAISGDLAVADSARDLLKLAVIERHRATGNIGIGFVRGFGMKTGALASSVAHDAHNIIVVGTNDTDILAAARRVAEMGGGLCVAREGAVLESFPLPIAGLVSDRPLPEVRAGIDRLRAAAASLGCPLPDPFMTLSFLALSPIPELKVTDLGLVDAVKFERAELFVS